MNSLYQEAQRESKKEMASLSILLMMKANQVSGVQLHPTQGQNDIESLTSNLSSCTSRRWIIPLRILFCQETK